MLIYWLNCFSQYTIAGEDGPAVLLVHGFGAFGEHYRDNIHGLARAGNRVWAITLLGFGKSEKPNIVYTELLWAELLRDFIVDVVGEPVHLVGNSIGGMIYKLKLGTAFYKINLFFTNMQQLWLQRTIFSPTCSCFC